MFYTFCTGNSAYGRTLVNLEKHKDVSFHQSNDYSIANLINNNRFQGLDEIGESIVEVEQSKAHVRLSVPIQIGFFVLEYAKLLLLRFYFDFLLKFLAFDTFSLIQCDTDSLYLSLCEKNLFATVRPGMRELFAQEYEQWMSRGYCDSHKTLFFDTVFSGKDWNPQDCCKASAKYYLRQPGLFHLENISKGVVALSSKCYYCFGETPKCSSKEMSKVHNKLTENDHKHVLRNKTISQATN